MGVAEVIEVQGLLFPRGGPQGTAGHLQVEAQGSGGARQDRAADRGDVGALGNDHAAAEHLHRAGPEPSDQTLALLRWGAAAH
jgi:hypothetical protein